MGYFSNKESMQTKALKHSKEMDELYQKETNTSCANSTFYTPAFNRSFIAGSPKKIEVRDGGSIEVAYQEYENDGIKPCILNFASYKNPGGKFLDGSSAQEECLCHGSNLYNILEKFDKVYYLPHRRGGETNRAMYLNTAIFTPDVIFNYLGVPFKCDVLTCAAPNFAAGSRYYNVTSKENAEILLDRIEFIRKILEEKEVKTAILGAWGCGVFGQDPNLVASYMNQTFKDSNIDTIIYGVPKGVNARNYITFKRTIAETDL